MKAKEFLVKLH